LIEALTVRERLGSRIARKNPDIMAKGFQYAGNGQRQNLSTRRKLREKLMNREQNLHLQPTLTPSRR
jgi:hypothetical protein